MVAKIAHLLNENSPLEKDEILSSLGKLSPKRLAKLNAIMTAIRQEEARRLRAKRARRLKRAPGRAGKGAKRARRSSRRRNKR